VRSAAKCNPLLCSSIALTIAVKRICYLSLATISLACVLLIDYYYYRYSIVDSDIIIVLIDWKDVYYCSVISERELTFTFAIMLSPVRLSSVVCLSVCNVRAPYSGGSNFRQYFYGIRYLGHPLTFPENVTEIVPGEPLRRGS